MRPQLRSVLAAAALLMIAATAPDRLPTIHATTAASGEVVLDPEKRQVTIVHFWATWCAPCRVEMPILDAAFAKYHGDDITMLAISLDTGASRRRIAAAGQNMSFPVARLTDTDLTRRDVPKALPETRIYGRDGRLRYLFGDGKTKLDAATLDRIISSLLDED